MPLYEYRCERCHVTFEVIRKYSDAPVETCRTCGGQARRMLSAPAIQFKGTGWYITDYARKGKGGGESETSSSSDKSTSTTDKPAASSESKSASSESKSASSTPSTPSMPSSSTTGSSDKK